MAHGCARHCRSGVGRAAPVAGGPPQSRRAARPSTEHPACRRAAVRPARLSRGVDPRHRRRGRSAAGAGGLLLRRQARALRGDLRVVAAHASSAGSTSSRPRTRRRRRDVWMRMLEAFVGRWLALHQQPEGRWYALMAARDLAAPTRRGGEGAARVFRSDGACLHRRVAAASPGSSRGQVAWGYQFMLGALLHHLTDRRVERLSQRREPGRRPGRKDVAARLHRRRLSCRARHAATHATPALTRAPNPGDPMTRRFVDLSIFLENDVASDPPGLEPRIQYFTHEHTYEQIAPFFPGLKKEDLPDGEGWAVEMVQLSTHNGTHLDAPYHFHSHDGQGAGRQEARDRDPRSAARMVLPARREAGLPPLRRTATWSRPTTSRPSSKRIGHALKPLEIVVVNTRAGSRYGHTRLRRRPAAAWATRRRCTCWSAACGSPAPTPGAGTRPSSTPRRSTARRRTPR